jgi:hypothetical protein
MDNVQASSFHIRAAPVSRQSRRRQPRGRALLAQCRFDPEFGRLVVLGQDVGDVRRGALIM